MSFNQGRWSLKKYFCPICIGEQIGYAIEDKLFHQSETEGESDIFDYFYGDKNPIDLNEFQKTVYAAANRFASDPDHDHLCVATFICTACHRMSLHLDHYRTNEYVIDEGEESTLVKSSWNQFAPSMWNDSTAWIKKWFRELSLTEGVLFSNFVDDKLSPHEQELLERAAPRELINVIRIYNSVRSEVIRAIGGGLNNLATSGLRTLVDLMISHHHTGHANSGGSFSERIETLCAESQISKHERDYMFKITDWGNKAAHLGARLDREELIACVIFADTVAEKLFLGNALSADFLKSRPVRPKIKKSNIQQASDPKIIPLPSKD
jgi:hypothetical protein